MVKGSVAIGVGCLLVLQGCSSSESATFTKPGVSAAVAQRDADQCWRQAQSKGVPEEVANEKIGGAYAVGGLVGVMANRAANQDAYTGRLRDECMAKRGYKPNGS
jgi:hypothetical protein